VKIAPRILLGFLGVFVVLLAWIYNILPPLFLIGLLLFTALTVWKPRLGARILLSLLGLVLLVWLLIQTEFVQNIIIGKVTAKLSRELKTEVRISKVSLSLFNRLNLEGTLVRDQKKDTLLYAGKLKVRVTDWFFFKDKIDLKYAGLEDAVIKMQRKDSVWNYQFIADYFSPKDTAGIKPATKDSAAKKKAIALNVLKVDFKNVTFLNNDEWVGSRMLVKVGSMILDADTIDLNKKLFKINEIELDKPYFTMRDFDGFRPDSLKPKKINDTGLYFNSSGMQLAIKSVKITNGYFGTEKEEKLIPGYFDSHNIWVSKLNCNFNNVSFIKDTIKAKIEIAGKERSGLIIKKLNANFKLTPQIMEFAKLDLQTNRSHLRDYYAMKYRDFNEDMGEYIDSVVMDARFKNAEVSSDDIAFFAPELGDWKKEVLMSGRFLGTVSDFDVKNLFVKSGNATYISGQFAMKGLPDIDKTQITFTDGNVQTNYLESAVLYKGLKDIKTPNLSALGDIRFQGSFKGTISDFIANGNVSSSLGGAYANVAMKFPTKGVPSYNGTLITQQFNLGKFINSDVLGRVTFNGKVDGRGFSLSQLNTKLDGQLAQFEFNDYNYHDLEVNGTFQKKLFSGEFNANDTNFNFTSNIQVDLNGEQPSFNILGDLVNSDLKKLNFTKANFQLTGLFDLNFSGKNIDDFIGSAKILNANLMHDSSRLSFDSLALHASLDSGGAKILHLQSNEFDLTVRGRYQILDLPNGFQAFLHKYYPSLISEPASIPKNQQLSVELYTGEFDKYAQIIDKKLSGFNNALVRGSVNTGNKNDSFYFKASIPQVQYGKYKLEEANIEGQGKYDSLHLVGDVGKVYIGDSLFFPNTSLDIVSRDDHSDVTISTSANSTLNDAKLKADVYTLHDGVRINFRPSSFVVNDKSWTLEKQGEIVVRENFASAKNVKFTQGFQEIAVETEYEDGGNTNNLVIKLKNLVLGDFTQLVTKKPAMEGLANGSIYLRDFYGRFNADADISAEQFRLDNDSVGLVKIKAFYNNDTRKVSWDVKSDNEQYNFTSTGTYDLRDSLSSPLETKIVLNHSKISELNSILDGLFSNIDGIATGELTIKGKPNAPVLLGDVKLVNAGMTVDYTKVHYRVDSMLVKFQEGVIDFGEFTLKDDMNRTGTGRGKLYQEGFKNMRFDFDLSSNKMLLLNTQKIDNSTFYGRAVGKASFSLKGPEDNMQITIKGESNDTTHIYIPMANSRQSTDVDFIVFKQYGTAQEEPDRQSKINVDLDLTATNKAVLDVILDELTGDYIQATGNGRLLIHVPATGDISMKGRYNIDRGKYDFTFQSFIRKPFDLLPDMGNYIEWTGSPYNATINIDAQYTASNVSLKDLVSGSQTQALITGASRSDIFSYRGDVYVVAELSGKLSRPDIKFRIDFPQYSSIKNNPDVATIMRRLESDENEMLKQASMLIVFGSFYPETTGTNSDLGQLSASLGLNTISQKIAEQVNKILSNVFYKITGDKSFQFDITTSSYSSASLTYGTSAGNNRIDRQNIGVKINKSVLNDKIIFTVGSDFDFNVGNTALQSGNFQWLPDISVQFVLSADRKLRMVVFNKSSIDAQVGIIGRKTRQGVALSYTKDFPKEKIPANRQQNQPVVKPDAVLPPDSTNAKKDSTKAKGK